MLSNGLYQIPGQADVWSVVGGYRYLVPDPATLEGNFGGGAAWGKIKPITIDELTTATVRPWNTHGAPVLSSSTALTTLATGGALGGVAGGIPAWAILAAVAVVAFLLLRKR